MDTRNIDDKWLFPRLSTGCHLPDLDLAKVPLAADGCKNSPFIILRREGQTWK